MLSMIWKKSLLKKEYNASMHLSFKDIKFVHNFLKLIIVPFQLVQNLRFNQKSWLEIQQRQTSRVAQLEFIQKLKVILQAKEFCESQLDFHWSYETCECVKRSLVERGAGEEPRSYNNCGDYFSLLARRGNSILDIGGWVLLGSCLALVAILAGATYHYRWSFILVYNV